MLALQGVIGGNEANSKELWQSVARVAQQLMIQPSSGSR
jgi:hypothetical protein